MNATTTVLDLKGREREKNGHDFFILSTTP
jgi:hypothetical protein